MLRLGGLDCCGSAEAVRREGSSTAGRRCTGCCLGLSVQGSRAVVSLRLDVLLHPEGQRLKTLLFEVGECVSSMDFKKAEKQLEHIGLFSLMLSF